MNPKPRRRWFRFSLRTMLVVVTLVCVYLGWAMNWIRQRQEFLATMQRQNKVVVESTNKRPPPWPLQILGESGISLLEMKLNASGEEWERATSLFPESTIVGAPI